MRLTRVSKYIRQKLIELQGETDKSIIIMKISPPPTTPNGQIQQAKKPVKTEFIAGGNAK